MSRRLLVIAGVASLLLGGCGADPEPRIGTAPSSSAATPTPTPTETETVAESPESFIREWVKTDTTMQNSGDTSAYSRITAGCTSCRKVEKRVAGIYRNGGYVRVADQVVKDVSRKATDGTTSVYVISVKIPVTKYKESADAAVQSYEGGLVQYEVTVKQSGSNFMLTDYAELVS